MINSNSGWNTGKSLAIWDSHLQGVALQPIILLVEHSTTRTLYICKTITIHKHIMGTPFLPQPDQPVFYAVMQFTAQVNHVHILCTDINKPSSKSQFKRWYVNYSQSWVAYDIALPTYTVYVYT